MAGNFKDIAEGAKNRFAESPLGKQLMRENNLEENNNIDKSLASYSKAELSNNRDVNENSPIQNKLDGIAREKDVRSELIEKYPESQGYNIVGEAYLRDKDGNIVRDPNTGHARRIDFVVIKDGKAVNSIEVTSKTADKTSQMAKEERIRRAGGNFIKDTNGNLTIIPSNVHTQIERRD